MYNNILRKITSLTLLTILLASSAVVGLPNALPHAQASTNANLFVSAENSQWNNYFAGPQVIQVIVADPDINRLDQAYGEPVVTVNGKRLRMAQATDGNWYAYFADRNQALIADKTSAVEKKGLNFGEFCGISSDSLAATLKSGWSFTDTKGYTVATGVPGSLNASQISGNTISNTCSPFVTGAHGYQEHVVRQNKTINANPSGYGVGLNSNAMGSVWPIIQLYDFSAIPSTVTVDYQKNGGDQIVNLTFDRIPQNLITTTVDRNAYPQNSQVFVQVNDPQLNIDPTEDDSWTWGTNANSNTVYYEAFTRNGAADADGTAGMQNLIGNMTAMMFNHNGKLIITPASQSVRVLDFQANGKIIYQGTQRGDPAVVQTLSLGAGTQPLTLIEQGGVNTGVFGNWDGSKKSEIVTVDSPIIRGQSAVVRYNDISTSIVGGFAFASLTQTAQNNTWASGQRIPVTLTDSDDNKNSKLSERMFLWDPSYKRSTAMVIGTPFTLSTGTSGAGTESASLQQVKVSTTNGQGTLIFGSNNGLGDNATASNLQEDEAFSARPIFQFTSTSGQHTAIGQSLTTVTITNNATSFGTLGTSNTFGVLAATTITNTGNTTINGDLGLSPGSAITGFYGTVANDGPGIVVGHIQQTTVAAQNAITDASTAFNVLGNATCTNPAPWPANAGDRAMGGLTLGPGVYCSASGSSLSLALGTTLTLSGAGTYIFNAGSTVITGAGSHIVLTNGATADHVFWRVGSSATLAASAGLPPSTFVGTVIARTAISESGGNANIPLLVVTGRLLALNAAVTFAADTTVNVPTTSTPITATALPPTILPVVTSNMGQAGSYAILSGNFAGVITNGVTNQLVSRGNVGHTSTETAPFTFGTGFSDVSSSTTLGNIATPNTPIGDAHALLTSIGTWDGTTNTGLACTHIFPNGAINLATDVTHGAINQYAPGVYCINGAASIGTAGINLNATGTYVFKINGALTSVSGSHVTFNGVVGGSNANAGNVFWAPVGGASMGANTQFSGTILSGSAAISTGAVDNMTNARFISESAITIGGGANQFSAPPSTTSSTTLTGGQAASSSTPISSALFVDLKTTMNTLLKTIHNTNSSNAEGFKGFNFLNYDLRSFSSLNGATGDSISNVNVYLVYNNAGTALSTNGIANAGSSIISIANSTNLQDFINLNVTSSKVANPGQINHNLFGVSVAKTASIGLLFTFATSNGGTVVLSASGQPVVADFFSVGLIGDGTQSAQRINNGIYRYELEETGDNTGVFTGTNQYVMLNQLNIFDPNTYSSLRTIQHDVYFPAIQDMLQSEARAPQITYLDLGQDGVNTQISAQQDIPTHTGVISFDSKTYKIGDTVTITLNDQDLNVNNDLIDIYTAVTPAKSVNGAILQTGQDPAVDTVGKASLGTLSDGRAFGRLVDVQFGQQNIRWSNAPIPGTFTPQNTASCFINGTGQGIDSNTGTAGGFATSLSATGFSLVETGPSTGIFTGTFEIPDQLCQNGVVSSSVGQNIKVNYVDFRDDSGKLVEVSDNSGIKGNTGSVKLDKAVYPVPFGSISTVAGLTPASGDFAQTGSTVTSESGVFPMHRDNTGKGLTNLNTLTNGDVLVHIRVNDQDYNTSPVGTDKIAVGNFGPLKDHGLVAVQITRQGQSLLLATAGGPSALPGKIVNLNSTALPATQLDNGWGRARELGPMVEIAPDAGIFQADLPIRYTDGPTGSDCATNTANFIALDGTTGTLESDRFNTLHTAVGSSQPAGSYCVRQGDVLTVTYTDLNDASGHTQTVTDSSTFDLRNGVLQSDKSVYIIGSDMILTLVEPDLNLDSQTAETIPLDVVEWDSHAFKGTMGQLGGQTSSFDAKPGTFVETGKDTGIFQSVIKIPKQLNNNLLERGEQIHLEYTDWGPAGSKVVGANNQDIQLTIYTSNFGATVELDQKVYTWTDRVYITVVAPDHNFDPNLIDIIGDNSENQVTVSTRGNSLSNYRLVETGVDTGIFTGYVILTGDPNVKGSSGVDGNGLNPTGVTNNNGVGKAQGPTDGFLGSEEQDGVSVSFEFTRDQTVTGSALIRWNIGEIKWLEASYPANGQGVLQIVDPDMNLNPKAVDKFDTNVWSDSDAGGIKLTMTETGQATGIFQGTVYFTTNFQSSGNRLHVAEGDTVTGEYKDRTLPPPYTPSDQLRLTSTTFIGTIVPPLERAPASNPRIVDSFGNAITGAVKSGQQIQVTADLTNGQDRDQPFAYLVQIQDANGVTVSLSWITGTLTAGQSLNPAQSWTPQSSGTYTAQIFVWQSIDNPNALSPPLSTTINVA